jgi:hypothetical protein
MTQKQHRAEVSLALSSRPWRCEHRGELSHILLLVKGKWLRVATVTPLATLTAREAAEFIVHVVNDRELTERLIAEARAALSEMLEHGLNFTTESEADSVIAAIDKRAA